MAGLTSQRVGAAPREGRLLEGVEILECSSTVSAAYAGRVLVDLGATVYRLDNDLDLVAAKDSTLRKEIERSFHSGKRTVGRQDTVLLDSLGKSVDVLLIDEGHELVSGIDAVLARRRSNGLTVASVRSLRPRAASQLPLAGNGLTASAWAALSVVIGSRDRPPLTLPFDLPEYEAGANMAGAILLALIRRKLVGKATAEIEVGCDEVLAYYCGMIAANFIPYERAWRREGRRASGSGGVYPLGMFVCLDGPVALLCRTPREWEALLAAMGNPPWSAAPEFRDPRIIARGYADEADAYLNPWLAEHTVAQVVALGREYSFPVAAIRGMEEAIKDPQLEHRHFFESSGSTSSTLVPGVPFRIQYAAPADGGQGISSSTAGNYWPDRARPGGELSSLLKGVKVLDFSWVWSGPMVTSILADFGADVIKIEHERHLDPGRLRGRALRNGIPVEGPEYEVTPYFNQMNHGKRSVVVDITSQEGQTKIRELANTCDVVVENMRPGVLAKYGLGYQALSRANPGLIMLSMSMAGQDGPLRDLKGYASIMSAMAGVESLVGYSSDEVVGMFTPAFGDPNAAAHGITVLLAALLHRATSGEQSGLWIDLSQIETMLSVLRVPVAETQLFGTVDVPGNRHPSHVPYGHFRTLGSDRWIALAVRSEAEWRNLCGLVEPKTFATSFGSLSSGQRQEHRVDIETALEAWTATLSGPELVDILQGVGIPAALVHQYEEMVDDLRAHDGELCADLPHPYLGDQTTFFVPWHLDGQTGGNKRHAPILGSDTALVFLDLSDGTGTSNQLSDRDNESRVVS